MHTPLTPARPRQHWPAGACDYDFMSGALNQGISVVTGLQDHFDWASVAASAIGAGVGQVVGGAIGNSFGTDGVGRFAKGVVTGFAAGTAANLARGGRVSIQQVATDAFGQSMASAFVDNMSTPSYSGGPGLRATAQSTQAFNSAVDEGIANRVWSMQEAQAYDRGDYVPGGGVVDAELPGMSLGGSDHARNVARSLELANRDSTTYVPGVAGLEDLSPTKANAMRLGLMGPDGQTEGTWSSPVRQSNVVGVPLPPLGVSVMGPSLPEIELQQRYTGGVTQAVSMGWKEAFNSDNSIGQRLIYGGLALAGTPDMMVESMLYAPLNIGPAARETGQYAARAGLQTDSAERNMDVLRAVGAGAEAFSNVGAWLVGPRPQAAGMSAQELAAVRATSEGTSSSPFVVAPTRDAVRELKTFGMDVAERRAFFEGKQVIFEDPATAHPTVNIFQLSNDTLHAGIWDLVSDGSGAVASFSNRSRSLGNTLGVTNLELFGADLQNARLSDVLTRRGFTEGAPVFIDKYGFSKHVPTLRRMESLKNE